MSHVSCSSPEKSQLHLSGLVAGDRMGQEVRCSQVQQEAATPCTPGEPLPRLHHKHKDHAMLGFAAMNRMRINGQLCDVKLKAGMVTVSAHRVVLAACSPYFSAMFNGVFIATQNIIQ